MKRADAEFFPLQLWLSKLVHPNSYIRPLGFPSRPELRIEYSPEKNGLDLIF